MTAAALDARASNLAEVLAERASPEQRSKLLDALLAVKPDAQDVVYRSLDECQQRDVIRALADRYGDPLDEDLVETIRNGWLETWCW